MMIKPQHWAQCTEADLYSIYREKDMNLRTNIVVVLGVCPWIFLYIWLSPSVHASLNSGKQPQISF
jgi:hypothetical protein